MGHLLRVTETVSSSGIDIVRTVDLDDLRARYPAVPDDPWFASIHVQAALTGGLGEDLQERMTEDLTSEESGLVKDYDEQVSHIADPWLLGEDSYVPIWFVEEA